MYMVLNNVMNTIRNKVAEEYYNAFAGLFSVYDRSMEYLRQKEEGTFEIFYQWFIKEGKGLLEYVASNILTDNLDKRVNAFMKIYKSYMEDAIEEEDSQALLDFVYKIPKKIKEDFENFGFLEKYSNEYVLAGYKITGDVKLNYNYNIESGNIAGLYYFGAKGVAFNEGNYYQYGRLCFA